jgi:gamma-glutamylcyclotransferase (GGCT)/AIG2-like uncharacterized protein YtfP
MEAHREMKYFAYGSNCDPTVMTKKGVAYASSQPATLSDYRLLFNKKAMRESLPPGIGYANINQTPHGIVEGVLYDIHDEHLGRLDKSERYPHHYTRIEVVVRTRGGPVACTSYQARPDKLADGLRPSRDYLNHILAAKDFFTSRYFEKLGNASTFESMCRCCQQLGEVRFVEEDDRLHMLCQPCVEAQIVWADTRGRALTVTETQAIMKQLVLGSRGFGSIAELIQEAIAANIIDP